MTALQADQLLVAIDYLTIAIITGISCVICAIGVSIGSRS